MSQVHVELSPNSDGNLVSINIARGAAALSVFVYHYQIGHVLAEKTGISAFEVLALPGAVYAVPLFFVISGYCIHSAEQRRCAKSGSQKLDFRAYFFRRFHRIYPAYFIALLFAVLVNFSLGETIDFQDFIVHLFLVNGLFLESFNSINVVLWSVSVEFLLYLIYPVFYAVRLRYGLMAAVLFSNFVSSLSLLLSCVYLFPYTAPTLWFFYRPGGGGFLARCSQNCRGIAKALLRRSGG